MLPHRARVYLDANILIHILNSHQENAAHIAVLVRLIVQQHIVLATSELSIAEVLVRPLASGNHEQRSEYERIFNSAELSVLPINRAILIEAARLRGELKIKLPDVIHVSTASAFAAMYLLTEDLGIRVPSGMQIIRLATLSRENSVDDDQSSTT